jgi:hypothetical protein
MMRNNTRYAFSLLVLAFSACSHSLPTGTARQAASIGDACTSGADCGGLNGGCVSSSGAYLDGTTSETGTCRGGDSDPCAPVDGGFTGGDCAPGFACGACDVDTYGPSECHCQCDPDYLDCGPPCTPFVCLPIADACHDAACEPAECASLPVCEGP